MISREIDDNFNEDYCKWCYADGKFAYTDKNLLLDFLLSHMPNPEIRQMRKDASSSIRTSRN